MGENKLPGLMGLAKILMATMLLSRRYAEPSTLRLLSSLFISIVGIGNATLLAPIGRLISFLRRPLSAQAGRHRLD